MADDLLDVDWSSVDHAYGPATELPGLLRQPRSPEEPDRDKVVDQIHNLVIYQGTVYPAGAAIVPYLIALLADDGERPDPQWVHRAAAQGMRTAE
jgi:hypothetical protein